MSSNAKFGLVMGTLFLALYCFFYFDDRPTNSAPALEISVVGWKLTKQPNFDLPAMFYKQQ